MEQNPVRLGGISTTATEVTSQEGKPPEVTKAAPPPTLEELPIVKTPESRIFRSRIAGMRVQIPGKVIVFPGGWYQTTDPEEIKHLDNIANKTPTIYTDEEQDKIARFVFEAKAKAEAEGTSLGFDVGALLNAAQAKANGDAVPGTMAVTSPLADAVLDTRIDPTAALQAQIARLGAAAARP
jgi:hypothetical protein